MIDVRITKLERDERGFFTANVTAVGVTVRVDNCVGSWTATADQRADPGSKRVARREITPAVAARLQSRVRAYLRGEAASDGSFQVDSPAPRRNPIDAFREPARSNGRSARAIGRAMAEAGRTAIKR